MQAKSFLRIAIVVVIVLNCVVLFLISLLAVYGDGSATGVYTVWAVGFTWIAVCSWATFRLVERGADAAGLVLTVSTLPAGFILTLVALRAWQTVQFYRPDPAEFKAACSNAHTRYPVRPARRVESIAFERASERQPSVVINHIRLEAGTRVVQAASESYPWPAAIKFVEGKVQVANDPRRQVRYYRSVTYGKSEDIAGFTADVLVTSRYFASDADLGRSTGDQGLVGYEVTVVDRRDGAMLGSMRYYTYLARYRACGEAQGGVLSVRDFILQATGVK